MLWKMRFLFLIVVTGIVDGFVPSQIAAIKASKIYTTEIRLKVIGKGALKTFRLDVGRYPNTSEGISALYEKPNNISSEVWNGPYVYVENIVLKDAWLQDFRYLSPGVHNTESFDLFSIGRDGIEGTIDDINNWDESKAWVEHYRQLKSWYWSDLLKSWYWKELWSDSWVFRMSLLVSLVFGLFIGLFITFLIRLIIKYKKNK